MKKKKILLVDGSYCLYKTYYAFINLKNKSKKPTGVLYGYIKILNKLIKEFNPARIIIVFDTSTKTFRHKLYENYKNNRSPMPKNLEKQITPLKEIIHSLGIPIISINNIEADDVIGTLSKKFAEKKYYVFIYSADKDMTQLVNKRIFIIPGKTKKEILNKKNVYKKYGIFPESIADFLSLVGDISDNIPGVPGIGKKTAVILLKKFISIKKIYQNISNISTFPIRNIKNIIKNLKINKESAFLSYKLTKINSSTEIPNLSLMLKNYKLNISALIKKLQYYQLYEFLKEISHDTFPIINIYHKKKKKEKKIKIIDIKTINQMIEKIKKKNIFSIALANKKYEKKNIFLFSISINDYITWWYISYQKNSSIIQNQILENIKPILENKKYKKIGKNLKDIFHILKKFNITLKGMYFDTMIIFYFYKMRNEYVQYYSNLIQQYKNKNIDPKLEEKKFIISASLISQKIYIQSKKYMYLEPKQKIFKLIDIPLLPVLSEIENNGVLIKKKILEKQKKNITNTIKKLKKKIYYYAEEKFNINSTNQLKNILFKKHNLPCVQKTKKGHISINESVLNELSKINILPKIILQYRLLNKIKNTYLKNLIRCINTKTNRIHTTYHVTATSTGRLSSSNPNLQNIPIKTKLGRKMRIAFIVKKKWWLITADYAHIELKVIAHYSKDINLIKDLSPNNDIHIKTASHIFNIPIDNVQPHHRYIAKTINFSILYGISPFGLSQKLNVSRIQAKEYITSYFERYKKVKKYIKNTHKLAQKKEYIKTLFGRKIYISNINSKNKTLRKNAKRFCINAIIQNTASDIIKISMINLHAVFQKKFFNDVKMIMQIHDELIFEVKEEKKDIIIHTIKNNMENSTKLIIPLNVVMQIGKNWKEMNTI